MYWLRFSSRGRSGSRGRGRSSFCRLPSSLASFKSTRRIRRSWSILTAGWFAAFATWPRLRTSYCSRRLSLRGRLRCCRRGRCRGRCTRLRSVTRAWLSSAKDSRTSEIVVQCDSGLSFSSACSSIRNCHQRNPAPANPARQIAIAAFRIALKYSSRHRFVDCSSTPLGIAKVAARQTRHATPVSRISVVATSLTMPPVTAGFVVTRPVISRSIFVPIVTRTWVAIVIRQRIPADIVTEVEVHAERDQRRTPPTTIPVVLTARTPRP